MDSQDADSTAPLVRQLNQAADAVDSMLLSEDGGVRGPAVQEQKRDKSEMWMWDDNPQSREVLLALFMMVDKLGDGSGSMSSTELMHVLINLGEDVDDECADVRTPLVLFQRFPHASADTLCYTVQEMCDIVDFDRDGEISFDEFYDLMTGRLDLEAQLAASIKHQSSGRTAKTGASGTQHLVAGSSRSIRDIKAIFEEMDEDGSGYLDRNEVRNVSSRVYTSRRR